MFPLKKRAVGGYRQGQKTYYSDWHLGTDWEAVYVPLYAPFDGEIVNIIPKAQAPNGGNTIWFKPDHDKTLHRFLHLDRFLVGKSRVKEGQQIAITGNTGTSQKPHLHHDISRDGILRLNDRSNFIDPEKYNFDFKPMTTIKATVVINGGLWATLPSKLQAINDWFKTGSGDKLNIQFTAKASNFSSIPFKVLPDGSAVIDEHWFDANVLDRTAHTTILVVRDEDLPDNFPGGFKLVGRTLGYMGKVPTKTVIACGENDTSEIYPGLNAFIDYAEHELMHTCYLFSGSSEPRLMVQDSIGHTSISMTSRIEKEHLANLII